MTYALTYDVPGNDDMYRKVSEGIGDEPAKGLLAHLVLRIDGGLRHIGVWDSAEDWERFNTERVRPAVHAMLKSVGFEEMPPDPEIAELDVLDIRLPA